METYPFSLENEFSIVRFSANQRNFRQSLASALIDFRLHSPISKARLTMDLVRIDIDLPGSVVMKNCVRIFDDLVGEYLLQRDAAKAALSGRKCVDV